MLLRPPTYSIVKTGLVIKITLNSLYCNYTLKISRNLLDAFLQVPRIQLWVYFREGQQDFVIFLLIYLKNLRHT